MALRRSLGVVAIPLAETLITLAASISGLVPGVLEDGVLMPHQQAADELGSNMLGRAAEEGLGKGWEVVVAMGVAWRLFGATLEGR